MWVYRANPGRTTMGFETISAGSETARLYITGTAEPGRPGVVLLHAWWGLNDDVVRYADRLAAAGLTVAAPDMFGGQVADTVDEAEKLAAAGDEGGADVVALAAVDELANRLGPDVPI